MPEIFDYELAREKRIQQVLKDNPDLNRKEAEDHIDYMDSEGFNNWMTVNHTKHQFEEERMERTMKKELENPTKFGKE